MAIVFERFQLRTPFLLRILQLSIRTIYSAVDESICKITHHKKQFSLRSTVAEGSRFNFNLMRN